MSILTDYLLERENMRVSLMEHENHYEEVIAIKLNNEWVPILGSLTGYNTLQLENFRNKSPMIFNYLKSKKKKIYFQLINGDFEIKLDYCMEESNILHVRYQILTNQDVEFSKLGVRYQVFIGQNPDFTWIPHICPRDDLVVGDHVFRSPVMIYRKNDLAFIFLPDLKTISKNRPFQMFMDMKLESSESLFSFGFGSYQPYKHVLFRHKINELLQAKEKTDLTFRYYLIVMVNKTDLEIIQFINKFLWEKYGRKFYYESLSPQIIPFEKNVREGFDAIFKRHKFWGDIEINGVNCGGFWVGSWLGKDKSPLKFFNPSNIDEFKYNFNRKSKNAAIYNNPWFLNIRSSYGIKYFGENWHNKDLLEKSNAMMNLMLQLPRNHGLFPSIVLPSSKETSECITINGTKGWGPIDYYHVVDATLAMYWGLRITRDFNLPSSEIKQKSFELANFLAECQLDNGAIPTFINFDENNNPIIIDDLINSASSGASLMFFTELYKISGDSKILNTCEKIAKFISSEIIPVDKWHDFEAFYSCTYPQKVEYDYFTHSNIMNNLCIYWCAEGFIELYRISHEQKYLDEGERILGILSLFQQVWNMPYMNFDTFGGFGVQNADAELNDARQGLFVKTYMEYYLETGKWEYMERGIAALRASWALQILPDYREICPGNFEGITTDNDVDKGCVSENYGHLGRDQRIPGFIMFDWGVGTASMATAYAKKNFGDLFIDFQQNFVFGIDGILIKKFDFEENKVIISYSYLDGIDSFIIKARKPPTGKICITLNDKVLVIDNEQEIINGYKYSIQ